MLSQKIVKKVVLIGPLPKGQATGVSLGFDSLVAGFRDAGLPHVVIDTVRYGTSGRSGMFNLSRAVSSLFAVLAAWLAVPGSGNLYMTIASSRLGFLRDCLIIWGAFLWRRRIVVHLKGGGYGEFYVAQPRWLQWIIRKTLSRASWIVVLGELLKAQFSFIPNVDEFISVIPNGLPRDLSYNPPISKNLPRGTPLRLLYLSNLVPSKGYMDLLEACALVKAQGVCIECDFCGVFLDPAIEHGIEGGDLQHHFQEAIVRLGLEGVVHYHGTVKGEVKQKFLREAHLFVLPTYYPWEGQPISIIEALALGTPIVSTPHKGIPEEVIDGYNGRLIQARNPAVLADTIRYMSADEDRYKKMSRNCIEHFEAHFKREIHLERLVSLICDVHVPANRFC